MTCHILCPECSKCLGDIFLFYTKVAEGYNKALINDKLKKKIHVDNIGLNKEMVKDFGFIFKALDITNLCCPIHLLGQTDFRSNYY